MINSLYALSLSGIANAKRICLLALSLVFLYSLSASAQIITTAVGSTTNPLFEVHFSLPAITATTVTISCTYANSCMLPVSTSTTITY